MRFFVVIISVILISVVWLPESISNKIMRAIKTYTTALPIKERWNKYRDDAEEKLGLGLFYLLYIITMTLTLIVQYCYYLIKYIIAVLAGKEDTFLG